MATETYLVGGVTDGSDNNLWEVTDTKTALSVTNQWSVKSGATAYNVVAIAKDLNGDYYIGTASEKKIYKYNGQTMTLDTTWASSGIYTCSEEINGLYCGTGNELIVGLDEYGVPDITVLYLNAAGTLVWAKDAQTGVTQFTATVRVDSSGNPVGFGTRQSTGSAANKYSVTDGSLLVQYLKAGGAYDSHGGWVFKDDTIVGSIHPVSAPYGVSVIRQEADGSADWSVNLTKVATLQHTALTVDAEEDYVYIGCSKAVDEDTLYRVDALDGTGEISIDLGADVAHNGMDFNEDGELIVCCSSQAADEFGNTAIFRVVASDLSTVSRFLTTTDIGQPTSIVIRPSAQVAPQLVDMKSYSKALVACAHNEVWYESANGTMTEVTAANGDIDTTKVFSMCEGFQKAFIANRANLKVLDLANTKLNTTDAGATACVKGTILTGGSSGAQMIVDYVDGVTDDAAMNVYGFRTTAATFTAEAVTGNGGQSFTLSAVETAPPHWYDWTPFGNDTATYGSLPSQAYILALYRGRLVLAGHNHYPHLWWMSKIGDPWSWLYDSTDPLSAVAGNNVDAGEIGDIIRAMIPNGDDFLLFGCANSFWILRGDPIESGSIDKIDDKIGIFSPWSWCQDSQRNTYFFGTGGFWKINNEGTNLQNLSFNKIPNLVDDWAVDPTLHRITVAYDPQRHGIIICKITLATGVSEGYFYSLITEGFYPETYAKEAAPFSAFYFESDDPDYKHLVLGCTDGLLRYFEDTAKSDSTTTEGAAGVAINSFFTLAPQKLAEGDNQEGLAKNFCFTVGGGKSGTTYKDSDGFSYEFHVADDAETLAENVLDGATARESGSFTTTGRQTRVRKRVRGLWFTCKCYNSTLNETWCMNKLTFDIKPVGDK